jgi:hypothetical protein
LAQVLATDHPEKIAEASGHPYWDTSMNELYHSLMTNDTWDILPLPKGRNIVICKWVYRNKYASNGIFERHKDRLVSKGFSQVEGIEYNKNFPPIDRMNSICLVLSLSTSHKSIKWNLNPPSCMGICKNKSTWNCNVPNHPMLGHVTHFFQSNL